MSQYLNIGRGAVWVVTSLPMPLIVS